jgi:hypothetical protein
MKSASEIYYRAAHASREEHKRLVRQFIAGKIQICPCGMDMEREAIVAAFDAALSAVSRASRCTGDA